MKPIVNLKKTVKALYVRVLRPHSWTPCCHRTRDYTTFTNNISHHSFIYYRIEQFVKLFRLLYVPEMNVRAFHMPRAGTLPYKCCVKIFFCIESGKICYFGSKSFFLLPKCRGKNWNESLKQMLCSFFLRKYFMVLLLFFSWYPTDKLPEIYYFHSIATFQQKRVKNMENSLTDNYSYMVYIRVNKGRIFVLKYCNQ